MLHHNTKKMFEIISQEEINEAVADAFMIFVPKEDKLRAHNKDLKNFKFEIEWGFS